MAADDANGGSDKRAQTQAGQALPAAARPAGKPPRKPVEPGKLLLAQLCSTLIGALIGFGCANAISLQYTSTFKRMAAEGAAARAAAEREIEATEVEWKRAATELGLLQDQLRNAVDEYYKQPGIIADPPAHTDTSGDAAADPLDATGGIPEAPASQVEELEAPIGAAPGIPADAVENTFKRAIPPELFPLRDKVNQLRRANFPLEARRQSAAKQIVYWDQELPGIYRQINLLDGSSAAIVLFLAIIGFLAYPLMLAGFESVSRRWTDTYGVRQMRTPQMVLGFFAGLNLAIIILFAVFNTFGLSGSFLADPSYRLAFGGAIVVMLGFAGALIGGSSFGPEARRTDPYREYRMISQPKILDSSVLIDGRLAEVAATGFLDGCLIVTNSVLRELQNLADSADGRRRVKGRAGLELVREMQEDPRIQVRVFDDSSIYETGRSTDDQLISVCHAMDAMVVTNDFNLNRVAAIQNVRVINLNALANAIKTKFLPGDMLEIEVVDHGKQRGQGVGYLPDGTMVVIEDGEAHIGQLRWIKITSVTQTQQGRLIFGRADLAEEENGHG